MSRALVRRVLAAYDHAGSRLRAFATEPTVPDPLPTIADELQWRLARTERQRSELAELIAQAAAQKIEAERRIAEIEAERDRLRAETAALQEAQELDLARRAQQINLNRGVMPS